MFKQTLDPHRVLHIQKCREHKTRKGILTYEHQFSPSRNVKQVFK